MKLEPFYMTVTTDASGDGTATANKGVLGKLYAIDLIDGTFDDGVDITVATINNPISGVTKTLFVKADFNTDSTVYPRTLVHDDAAGAALTGTAGGDRAMPVVDGTLKVTIAQGGNAKTGGCIVYVEVND